MPISRKSIYSSVHGRVMAERQQHHETRVHLYKEAERRLERPLVSFFTSFSHPAGIDESDADVLQSVLGQLDLTRGLAVLISSPGGDGLTAERIVNVLRSHSGTNDYWCLVPAKAKSAATTICMGASKIYMAPTSELGPVDPQIFGVENNEPHIFSAHSLVKAYDNLILRAARAKGNIEPYLQQLAKFDARKIEQYKTAVTLAEDIAIKTLESGMMKGKKKTKIKQDIRIFLDPSAGTHAHGRPIYADEAERSGLHIERLDLDSELWKILYELYVRVNSYVSGPALKAVESAVGGAFATRS